MKDPAFAIEAGLAALRWLAEGHGYEIASPDVCAAYSNTMGAAENAGRIEEAKARVRVLVEQAPNRFVIVVLGRELGLSATE